MASREHMLVAKYKRLKSEALSLDAAFTLKKKEIYTCQQEIIELLEAEDKTRTAVYDELGSISLAKSQVYASCTKENQELLFSFLREVDRADIIKETVNAKTLSSFVKELIEDGTAIPECISYYLKPGVRFNPAN